MKYVLICIITVFAAVLAGYVVFNSKTAPASITALPHQDSSITPTLNNSVPQTVTVDGNVYAYKIYSIKDLGTLSLIANPKGEKSFQQLVKDNTCINAINAGFYDTEGRPLGLFKTKESLVHSEITSTLLDGYLWIDQESGAGITAETPPESAHIALQNGPLLITGKILHTLKIKDDESARRSFAAISENNELWFGIVNTPDNTFMGPLLGNLPMVIKQIAKQNDTEWISAINLDGGSASAYISGNGLITELTPVGGIFCMQ